MLNRCLKCPLFTAHELSILPLRIKRSAVSNNLNTGRFCGSVPIGRMFFWLRKSPRLDWGGNEPPEILSLVLNLAVSKSYGKDALLSSGNRVIWRPHLAKVFCTRESRSHSSDTLSVI